MSGIIPVTARQIQSFAPILTSLSIAIVLWASQSKVVTYVKAERYTNNWPLKDIHFQGDPYTRPYNPLSSKRIGTNTSLDIEKTVCGIWGNFSGPSTP